MQPTTKKRRRKPAAKKLKTAKRVKPNLDSVLDQIADRHDLTIDRESCQNIASVGFYGGNLPLAIVATDLLFCEKPSTLRGLMYRTVSAGWLPSTGREHYTRLGRIMTRLREAGVVPFDWIVDGVRATDKPSSWSGLADFAETVRNAYRLDFWARLPHYIHFIVEKDALAGTLSPVTNEYDVPLSAIRGYTSLSFAHEIARGWNQIDKPIFCYFLGDFDASGFDLQRDIREKLERYCPGKDWCDADSPVGLRDWFLADENSIFFERIGVLETDFADFDLLPLVVKQSDTRARKFRQRHGDRCAELDALPSSELRRRVKSIIERHIDIHREEWERLRRVEEAEQRTLSGFIESMEGAA